MCDEGVQFVVSLAFLLIPIVGSLIPLLILPVISKEFGRDGWAAIAIGQSIGAAGAVLMELG